MTEAATIISRDAFIDVIKSKIEWHHNTLPAMSTRTVDQEPITIPEDGSFSLHWNTDSGVKAQLPLEKMYHEYLEAKDDADRETVIRSILHLARRPPPLSPVFDEVKPFILPRIRHISYYEIYRMQCQVNGKPSRDIPHIPITPTPLLCAELVRDNEENYISVTQDHLDTWGKTFQESPSAPAEVPWRRVGNVFLSTMEDGYDVARMLLPQLIATLPVTGKHVVLAPSHSMLLVTGSEDVDALNKIATMATAILPKSTPVFTQPVVLLSKMPDGSVTNSLNTKKEMWDAFHVINKLPLSMTSSWHAWNPTSKHGAYKSLMGLRKRGLAFLYQNQKGLMDAIYQKKNPQQSDKIVAASNVVLENSQTGDVISYCIWTDGSDATLPEADFIMFCDPQRLPQPIIARVEWKLVMSIMSESLVPVPGVSPTRYSVGKFPNEDQIKQMLENSDQKMAQMIPLQGAGPAAAN